MLCQERTWGAPLWLVGCAPQQRTLFSLGAHPASPGSPRSGAMRSPCILRCCKNSGPR